MRREILKVTWKIHRKARDRTPEAYCSYIVENEKRKHRLKTREGTRLFNFLINNVVVKDGLIDVLIDGIYKNEKLMYVTNFRKVGEK